jgi:glucan phosphoethanolaminetransferase (alkaline phosphatase superfamily)
VKPTPRPLPSPEERRKAIARVAHRALTVASALLVPALCLAGDLAVRGRNLPGEGVATYAGGALLSMLVWALGMEAARHPRRGVRVVSTVGLGLTAAFGIGLQVVVQHVTHAYLGRRALLLAMGIPNLTRSSYITHEAPRLAMACLVPGVLVVGLSLLRTRRLGLRSRHPSTAAAAATAAVLLTAFAPLAAAQGFQCLPPDILWINATGAPLLRAVGLQERPKALPVGAHESLPAVPPAPDDAPPIVLILGESVRRDEMCSARTPGCSSSPRLDEAAPSRIGYAHAFSTASCTELSSTVVWTGLQANASIHDLTRAPLLWDWAKARGYRTGYFTSQNLLAQQSDLFLRGSRIDRLREARDRMVDAPIDDGTPDEATTDEALAFLEAPGPPPFLVVHHANTHAPYRQTPGFTPHPDDDPRSRYRNGLVHNDAVLGDLLARLRHGPKGRHAIVLYTSDHGEAFGEHGAFFHSFDLYAEQIDVPLWIDAPPGTLPEATLDRLRHESATRAVSLADLTATLIDLTGGLDLAALRPHVAALAGTSLLRDPAPPHDVLLWNCPPTRECAADAFGAIAFPLKLHYVGHEHHYACHDLLADPGELTPLPLPRCAALLHTLDTTFGPRPQRLAPNAPGD